MTKITLIYATTPLNAVDGDQVVIAQGESLGPDGYGEYHAILGQGDDITIRNFGTLHTTLATFGTTVLIAGDNLDFLNGETGVITGTSATAVINSANSLITNKGEMTGTNVGLQMYSVSASTVNNFGTISGGDLTGMMFTGYCDDVIMYNSGTISGLGEFGVGVSINSKAVDMTIVNSGAIFGEDSGVRLDGINSLLVNSGEITGNGVGLFVKGAASVVNSGVISGDGAGIVFYEFLSTFNLNNSGTINGVLAIEQGRLAFHNSGDLNGDLLTSLVPVDGDNNDDVIRNSGFIDGYLRLGAGNDIYNGVGGVVTGDIHGGEGNDKLYGGSDVDLLFGDAGRDVLRGAGGDDILTGGAGRDVLKGGAGADVFVYLDAADSVLSQADIIRDFESGVDLIDLGAVSADTLAFAGNGGFSGAGVGEVRYQLRADGAALVFVDVDGDGAADMRLTLQNVAGLAEADFIL